MNSFTNSILSLMLGWLRALLNAARDFVSSDSSTAFFEFFRHNWRFLFLALCIFGFALDILIYLIRWRPSPIRIRRRARQERYVPQPPEPDEYYDFDSNAPTLQAGGYAPIEDEYMADTAPTQQYQMPTQQYAMPTRQYERQGYDPQPAYPTYATPQYAPEALQYGYEEPVNPPLWEQAPQAQPFAPPAASESQFAFGMAPSFGSAQSEPKYYHQDTMPSFAPPQFAKGEPADTFAPPAYFEPPEPYEDPLQPTYQEPSPNFRPFSDRETNGFAPPKTRGLGAVAKRARNLLNADEAYESLTYQDLQPTVDVSKAFHAPVYPEKKPPEGDQ